MRTNWDYSGLATSYLDRADYSFFAIDSMIRIMGLKDGNSVADIGAGVAHLTLHLLRNGLKVTAIEPNDDMRTHGKIRTESYENVEWLEATCENTLQNDSTFEAVFFGSSFNVCEKDITLSEVNRVLKKNGWIGILYNHRDLEDDIQKEIEKIILNNIPTYDYGTRRIDQTRTLADCEYFREVAHIDSIILHRQKISEVIIAWKSHATLKRQAGVKFDYIIEEISKYLSSLNMDYIDVPYKTNIWISQVNKD
jgi:ubiquinone/menaquinone biosynthesis C-methylase UbiE